MNSGNLIGGIMIQPNKSYILDISSEAELEDYVEAGLFTKLSDEYKFYKNKINSKDFWELVDGKIDGKLIDFSISRTIEQKTKVEE